jgi:hypothetical protein
MAWWTRPGVTAGLVALVCAAACGNSSPEAGCTQGESTACGCTNGARGAQVCESDGTFGACDCAAAPVSEIPPGYCTTTLENFSGNLQGLEGADALCAVMDPGSHFYRASRDGQRAWIFTGGATSGYGDLEMGACWDCNGWTTGQSGDYGTTACPTGYETVGAMVPITSVRASWNICENNDWPLACCTDA